MFTRSRRAAQAPALIALLCIAACAPRQPAFDGTVVDRPAFDFTLTDQYHHPFRLADQLGHVVVLFFGYTHCPDVCPTTLAHLARDERVLTPAERARLRVAFITVDPERDSPATLGRYVSLFDSAFVGLTGTERQLDPVYAAYHVYHEKAAGTAATGYLVTHSGALYLISSHGTLRVIHQWNDDDASVLHDLKELLS